MTLKKRKKVSAILTPIQLASIPNNIVDLYAELEEFVIVDFCRRLKKVGEITSTAEYQRQRAKICGIRNIEAKIAATLNLTFEQIESLFPDIAAVSIAAESEIYKAAKLKAMTLNDSQQLRDYLSAAIKNTKGDIQNITQSLGFATMENGHVAYSDIATFYQKELNLANLKISSGITDYNTAIKQAVKKISDSGLRYVDFPSKWSNQVDVAARRAILTGTHQMSQEMTNANAKKIIKNDDDIYYEVSAHGGARNKGSGIENHEQWQGKVYKLVGSSPGYPNLAQATGLGNILGLSGVACRHSYQIFILGASVRTYTDEQLKNINPPDFNYKGKTYDAYEASQQQRKIETAMRATKREILALKESGLDEEFKQASILLQQQRREYKSFSEAANLRVKNERSQVLNFNQSIARQATNASKKV